MIELKGISKTFNRGKANEVVALSDVDLNIAKGEFLVIVGANGSGKSTLLNTIAGSIIPGQGSVYLADKDVTTLPDYTRSRWIARVFQNPLSGTAPDLSILDNFRLASLRTSKKGLHVGIDKAYIQKVKEVITSLGMGLENKIHQPMGTLSGGQRQALTLLMTVMDKCELLLLDEPTAALDPRSADVVMKTADNLIKTYQLTAILITHNLKDAFTYGNRIIQMAEGKVIRDLSGTAHQALKQTDLFEWFA